VAVFLSVKKFNVYLILSVSIEHDHYKLKQFVKYVFLKDRTKPRQTPR
jgi:hypothetical protein